MGSIFQRSATSQQSKRVWTSYGIFNEVLPNLFPHEQINLQSVNRFFYDIAVSRVQISIEKPTLFFADCELLQSSMKSQVVAYQFYREPTLIEFEQSSITREGWLNACQINECQIFQLKFTKSTSKDSRMITLLKNSNSACKFSI